MSIVAVGIGESRVCIQTQEYKSSGHIQEYYGMWTKREKEKWATMPAIRARASGGGGNNITAETQQARREVNERANRFEAPLIG